MRWASGGRSGGGDSVEAGFFEGDADELAAAANSSFVEELLEDGFDVSLGDVEAGTDLLVGEALEDGFEDVVLARAEGGGSRLRVGCGRDDGVEGGGIEGDFAGEDAADGGDEFGGRAVLEEDACSTELEDAEGIGVAEAGGDHEDASLEVDLAGGFQEAEAGLLAEIEV